MESSSDIPGWQGAQSCGCHCHVGFKGMQSGLSGARRAALGDLKRSSAGGSGEDARNDNGGRAEHNERIDRRECVVFNQGVCV